jgi:ParB family chromosome partitioning protein
MRWPSWLTRSARRGSSSQFWFVPSPDRPTRFELIAGERRWRAAQLAQLHMVPAIVRDFTDAQAYEIALIENVQRADLSAIEEAQGYQKLLAHHDYTQEQLSEIIGKSRSHIANLLRLLTLPETVQDMVMEGLLSMGQVRPIINHKDCMALGPADREKRPFRTPG